MTQTRVKDRHGAGLSGRHVLLGLIAFFGVMFVANGFLVYYAVGTFSGGDRPDPYRSGLDYNRAIEAAERQAALGWTVTVDYEAHRLRLRFADRGAPVTGLTLTARLSRPAENREDIVVRFQEWPEGVYAADIALDPGNWVLAATSYQDEGGAPAYRLKRRVFVRDGS